MRLFFPSSVVEILVSCFSNSLSLPRALWSWEWPPLRHVYKHTHAHTHIPEHSSSCPHSSSLHTQTRDLSSGWPPKFEFTRFPRCRGKRKETRPTVFATVSAGCKCWEMNRPVLLVPGFDLSNQCEKSLNSDMWYYLTEVLVNNGGKIIWNAFILFLLLFYFLFLAS